MRRLLAAVACVALAACATPSTPVVVPADQIPFGLGRSPNPEPSGAPELTFKVAFVRRPGRQPARLFLVERTESTFESPAATAVRSLLLGPSDREADRGISTEIPREARLLRAQMFGQVVEVDLSREFQAAASSESFLLRVAQIVTTLTSLEGVTAARFSIDGEVVSVPTHRGETVDRPVTQADYADVLPK
ncbi:MAG TPA: GerMN domain-containing protein [Actinomycetota bacterium]